ncbi:exonuclease [Chloropicon primus]|uniref:RNA exonuclease 4 n=1 Tax=Chloropicon primus TaxID=1764295 RepID=A0A5B8MUS9_9CHLO|nr:exonuclease [Chloropicon primus]UPR02736.1 exonuclease [Chloropicon primus]|eukprot:QDZ23524.1 exonuclease [Chloropicon primus]
MATGAMEGVVPTRGDVVELVNLTQSPGLNGRRGRVVHSTPHVGRWSVQLEEDVELMVLLENMKFVRMQVGQARVTGKQDVARPSSVTSLHEFFLYVSGYRYRHQVAGPRYCVERVSNERCRPAFLASVELFGLVARGEERPWATQARKSAAQAFLEGKCQVSEPKGRQEVCALDCEMVEVVLENGKRKSSLGRVAIVDERGEVLVDTHCLPEGEIADYRTKWSGISPGDMEGAPAFSAVRQRVLEHLKGKIIVGHFLKADLQVLRIHHPDLRDTAYYRPLMRMMKSVNKLFPKSLKNLAYSELGLEIQSSEHDPVEDARAALAVYKKYEKQWEGLYVGVTMGLEELKRVLRLFKDHPRTQIGVNPQDRMNYLFFSKDRRWSDKERVRWTMTGLLKDERKVSV